MEENIGSIRLRTDTYTPMMMPGTPLFRNVLVGFSQSSPLQSRAKRSAVVARAGILAICTGMRELEKRKKQFKLKANQRLAAVVKWMS